MDAVRSGSLVLLHSPLVDAASWGRLPDVLRAAGRSVVAPQVRGDEDPPYAQRYVAAAAQALAGEELLPPLCLVGHSGAGPLLPQVAVALSAGGRPVGGYVFLDAGLPRPGADRLTLMASELPQLATALRSHLAAGGRFPDWSEDDLAGDVPDDGARAILLASIRPRDLGFFTEPLPTPVDWPDARCGFLRLSSAYDAPRRQACARGWPVCELDLGHFGALVDPEATAAALLGLLRAM